jgi:hypothetical protein
MAPTESAATDAPLMDVFVVGASGELGPYDPGSDPANEDPLLDLKAIGAGAVRQLREIRATTGQRPGTLTAGAARDGHREEIFQPVFVSPLAARHIFLTDTVFGNGNAAMDVDQSSRRDLGDTLTWRVNVHTGRWRRPRPALLYFHPSPSANLTVLELIPDRPRRFRTKRFIHVGVIAIDTLGLRLSRAARTATRDLSITFSA